MSLNQKAFDDNAESPENVQRQPTNITYQINCIPKCVIRSAINRVDFFYFSNLKKYFPKLKSISEFISQDSFLGNVHWKVATNSTSFNPSWQQQRKMVIDMLEEIKTNITKNSYDYEGSKEFCPISIKKKITNKQLLTSNAETKHQSQDWFVYDNMYGNTLEQSFVKSFEALISNLASLYDDILLIRNERAYYLYSFTDNGQRFEPDFILLMKCKSTGCKFQIFIEAKGAHLVQYDKWKEDFLKSLSETAITVCGEQTLIETECFKIMGLPFYEENKDIVFKNALKEQLGEECQQNIDTESIIANLTSVSC